MTRVELKEKVAGAIGAALDRQGYDLRDDGGVALADVRGGDFVNVTLLAEAALSAIEDAGMAVVPVGASRTLALMGKPRRPVRGTGP